MHKIFWFDSDLRFFDFLTFFIYLRIYLFLFISLFVCKKKMNGLVFENVSQETHQKTYGDPS